MKFYFCKNLSKPTTLFIFLISLITLQADLLNAESVFEDFEIDSSTKSEEDKSAVPTNPFEIVEMIRRINSLNDATNPSDAIDDALKSYNSMEDE